MSETFSRFDAADYLKTDEDISAYLDASALSGDPAAIAIALGAVARARNVSELARDAGLTPDGSPAFATVVKLAQAMGFTVAFRSKA